MRDEVSAKLRLGRNALQLAAGMNGEANRSKACQSEKGSGLGTVLKIANCLSLLSWAGEF